MGLSEDFAAKYNDKQNGRPCPIRTLRVQLPLPDLAALDEAIFDDKLTARAVAEVLTANGYDINTRQVRRHRRGVVDNNDTNGCKCPQT